jgi:sRNA-binding carbon storage regulator CsrA
MFVLSRKSRESVVVGGDDGIHRMFKVTVLGVSDGNVRLGFEVDPGVAVRHSETWERIDGNGRRESPMTGPAGSLVGYEAVSRFSGAT